jgi:hypothetical protein
MSDKDGVGQVQKDRQFAQLTLTFDRTICELQITGSVANFDEALNMLLQAVRVFEGKVRAAQVSSVLTVPNVNGMNFPPRGGH